MNRKRWRIAATVFGLAHFVAAVWLLWSWLYLNGYADGDPSLRPVAWVQRLHWDGGLHGTGPIFVWDHHGYTDLHVFGLCNPGYTAHYVSVGYGLGCMVCGFALLLWACRTSAPAGVLGRDRQGAGRSPGTVDSVRAATLDTVKGPVE